MNFPFIIWQFMAHLYMKILTKYMGLNEKVNRGTIIIQKEEVRKVVELKYLESTVKSSGDIGSEVKKNCRRVGVDGEKCQDTKCDKRMPKKLKGKVFKTVILPAMIYGLEAVELTKLQ